LITETYIEQNGSSYLIAIEGMSVILIISNGFEPSAESVISTQEKLDNEEIERVIIER